MSAARQIKLSYADYLALERETGRKHEYVDGVAYAMGGGTPEHSGLGANIVGALYAILRGRPCRVYNSELKFRVPATGDAFYADASVICGGIERHPEDPLAATNPRLLVEVLSPSTEVFDRGNKFAEYALLTSLRHYVLVSSSARRVEHYRRNGDGSWTYVDLRPGASLALSDLGGDIPIDEIYQGAEDAF